MIVQEGAYYLYRHIRLDNNVPFYVGIGEKVDEFKSYRREYSRAFDKIKRNDYWKRIVNITDYKVEILLESDDVKFIKEKEIEFVALYGRSNLDKGPLCNLTDGGDGCNNFKATPEQILKMKTYQRNTRARKLVLMNLIGNKIKEFETITDCSEFLKTSRANIKKVCKVVNKNNKIIKFQVRGYLTCYSEDFVENFYHYSVEESKNKQIERLKITNKKCKKVVYQYDLSKNLIKKFEGGVDADKELKFIVGTTSTAASKNKIGKPVRSIHNFYFFYFPVDFTKFKEHRPRNGIIQSIITK